jgi:hypothetical protein
MRPPRTFNRNTWYTVDSAWNVPISMWLTYSLACTLTHIRPSAQPPVLLGSPDRKQMCQIVAPSLLLSLRRLVAWHQECICACACSWRSRTLPLSPECCSGQTMCVVSASVRRRRLCAICSAAAYFAWLCSQTLGLNICRATYLFHFE